MKSGCDEFFCKIYNLMKIELLKNTQKALVPKNYVRIVYKN